VAILRFPKGMGPLSLRVILPDAGDVARGLAGTIGTPIAPARPVAAGLPFAVKSAGTE